MASSSKEITDKQYGIKIIEYAMKLINNNEKVVADLHRYSPLQRLLNKAVRKYIPEDDERYSGIRNSMYWMAERSSTLMECEMPEVSKESMVTVLLDALRKSKICIEEHW